MRHSNLDVPLSSRALLCCDSQANLITKQFSRKLKFKILKCNTQIADVSDNTTIRVHGAVNVNIMDRFNSAFRLNNALVIDVITEKFPVQHIDNKNWHGVSKLLLADPEPQVPGKIDVLLGVDVWGQIVKPKHRPSNESERHAQETSLGWILFGPVSGENPDITNTGAVIDLESTLEKFWIQEEISDRPSMSEEEIVKNCCQRHSDDSQMAGLSCRYRLKQTLQFWEIPVILLTSSSH